MSNSIIDPSAMKELIDVGLPALEGFLKSQTPHFISSRHPALEFLQKSADYSLLDGGKRFRPLLCFATARCFPEHPLAKVIPFAAAVEMVHTYSLIHDDLPIMDNDDIRRGKPTNHKVFGDAIALLSGSALLSEAFCLLAMHYKETPQLGLAAIELLATASGAKGMIGGQALDIYAAKHKLDSAELEYLHIMKTGALIKASVLGAAGLCEATDEQIEGLRKFSENVGLAFQIVDDILDFNPEDPEPNSFPFLLGLVDSKRRLQEASDLAIESIKSFGATADGLRAIVNYNLHRKS
jgi:geranylgeranyl diphosphate synthase type II